MSALANEYKAINLSQGFPNFPTDPSLLHCFEHQIHQNVHQYAPMMGLLNLRETLATIIQRDYTRPLQANDVLITAGATQAIFTIIQALVHENDEVIVIDPAYDCYRPALDLVKANVHSIPLDENFNLDLNRIKEQLNENTKLFLINNPHNPSGTCFSKHQINQLIAILNNYPNCVVVSDEVYEYISYTQEAISLQYYPEIYERLITISSFGKSLHITGWKVGYLTTSNTSLMEEIKKVHQFNVFSVSHFAQAAINEYLQTVDLKSIASFYQQKRDTLLEYIHKSKLKAKPSTGTYFQLVDIRELTDMNDVEYAVWLTKNVGLASIPLSVFYAAEPKNYFLRLCFAKDDETIHKAGKLICQI